MTTSVDNEDFEEDVILPNSPLANYIEEFGCAESSNLFSECLSQKTIDTNKNSKTYAGKQKSVSFSLTAFLLQKLEYLHRFLSVSILQRNLIKGDAHLNAFLKKTIESSILTPEDKDFVIHLTSDVLSPADKLSSSSEWLVLIITVFLAIPCISIIPNNSLVMTIPAMLTILVFVSFLLFFLHSKYVGRRYEVACSSLIGFPSNTKTVLTTIKDCGIRLIQEMELITRGFTSASVLTVAERVERSSALQIKSRHRQYSPLRIQIFRWLRTLFVEYKTLSLDMIQSFPIDETYALPNSLATLDIKEFGGLLNFDLDSSEILDATDNFSIQSLKTMHYLVKMQISEFYKQIAVRVFLFKERNITDCWKMINVVQCLFFNAQNIDKKIASLSNEVDKTLKFYKSIEANNVIDKPVEKHLSTQSPKNDIKVIVHNMSLHLKSALLRMIEIEDQFGKSMTQNQFLSEITKTDDQNLENEFKTEVTKSLPLLNIAKSEITAFEDCYKKFHETIDDFLYPENKTSSGKLPMDKIEPEEAEDTINEIERCDFEREIHDEVFEAIVSKTNSDELQEGAAFCGEEARKNSELASCMLQELKDVLVKKADEHEIREKVALSKKMTDISDNDSVCADEKEIDNSKKSENKDNLFGSYDLLLKSNVDAPNFLNLCVKTEPFSASIAAIAAHRQKLLGLSNEEFIDDTDSD